MTQAQIQHIFQQRYNHNTWKQFLGQAFLNARILSKPEELSGINKDVALKAFKLGNILLDEKGIERQVAIYEVVLAKGIVLERNRVGLRNLLRKYWKDIDAAFIAYYNPENTNWRFTYVSELSGFDAEGELISIKTEPKRYTYILGEGETCRTAAERFTILVNKGKNATLNDIKEAFSVEKLSEAFFAEYKKQYEDFVEFLTGKRIVKIEGSWQEVKIHQSNPQLAYIFNGDEKFARDFCKKLLGRIVFLYFIQKKGWLGVPLKSKWGEGNKDFIFNLFEKCRNKEIFYSEYLAKLFFDTLNNHRNDDIIELVKGEPCRIPYLNGGLFEEENKKFRNLIFPAQLFQNLFLFFNQYNFTIYEDDPNDHTIAVDPEMLGHIFENLLEDNKDKGAYYTPKEIVHYMCQECLIEYLTTWFKQHGYQITGYVGFNKPDQFQIFSVNEGRKGQMLLEYENKSKTKTISRSLIEKLLKKSLDVVDKNEVQEHHDEFQKALDSVKICDPAIGSGAFPMGLLHEIFNAKQALFTFKNGAIDGFNAASVKLDIIQNSIYGVDIEKGAVDIARLRFWLSLVVDEQTPKPLPNLDYKIVVGDSLLSKINNQIVRIDWNTDDTSHGIYGQELAQQKVKLLKKIITEQKEYFSPDSIKQLKSANIRDLKIDLLINQLELMIKATNQETQPIVTNFKDKNNFVKAVELYQQTIGWRNLIITLKRIKSKPNEPLHFFDWKLDFPEVMNEQIVGSSGFDIVIGNPPYVRQERLGQELKEVLKTRFPKVANGTADLYVYFINLGLEIFKEKGVLCYITLNKYLKTKYGLELRNELANNYEVDLIIDFFELPVFQASTDASITKIVNDRIGRETRYFPVKSLVNLNLFDITSGEYQKVIKDSTEWKFIEEEEVTILTKVYEKTVSLKQFSENKIYSGIKTAFNEAFVLTAEDARNLLNSESRVLVKKYAKSTDIRKWELKSNNRYFLSTGYDIDIKKEYPTAYKYLLQYEQQLNDRQDQGKHWWNLRACAYYPDFDNTKIIYMHTAKDHEFYLDTEGRYINNSCYMIISGSKYLFCFLNSTLFKWFKKIKFVAYGDAEEAGRVKLDYNKMTTVPIKIIAEEQKRQFDQIVEEIAVLKSRNQDITKLEELINYKMYKLYELTYEEAKLVDSELALSKQEYNAIIV
ncbi:Eco57I restriction-modification methylase domain-containing protein [Candidatus Dojkabacteria bacterium]|nr:Eco57I restriction-modification methylase domain-containing protein [Candidatus Dojkabacteria bacterium]